MNPIDDIITRSARGTTRALIRYENGELDFDQTVELFQILVDSGMLCHLQGSYHRMAEALHIDGYITLA